jgi:hypothetical protein
LIDTTDGKDQEEVKDESKQDDDDDNKEEESEETPDYLFLITQNFNCALICFSK